MFNKFSIRWIVLTVITLISITGCSEKNIVIEVQENTITVDGNLVMPVELDSILLNMPVERKAYPVKLYVEDDAVMGTVSDVKVSLRKNGLLKVKYFN